MGADSASSDYVAPRKTRSKRVRDSGASGKLARLVWPVRSLVTNREVAGPGPLEPEYYAKLQFITGAVCARCGLPFEIAVDPGQVCGACIANPPAWDRARAALIYGDVSRELVLALKRQGRRDGLTVMAGWMATTGAELLGEADVLVPVPLHYIRLVRRGFNQSVWLAAALSRLSGTPMCVDALRRARATPVQGRLSASARRRNVEGAFRARKSRLGQIRGRRVVLVDDVLTTGATAEACAKTLKRAGAACVDVLTLTRVAGPRGVPI